MELICKHCRFYRETKDRIYCWITSNPITPDQPICDFNFSLKPEKK